MKVIHIIPSLAVGGAEMCLTKLVTTQRANAPEVIVVSLLPQTSSHFERTLTHSKIRHEVVGVRSTVDLPRAIAFIARLIRAEKPDCLQGWLYYGDLIATLGLLVSGRRRSTRLCWGIRCSELDVDQYNRQLKYAISACTKLSRFPDAIIANSFAGRAAHERLGYQSDKLAVIHNGIDVDLFRPLPAKQTSCGFDLKLSQSKPLVGIAGRVDPQKDYSTFLRIVDQLPDVNFIAAGKDTTTLPRRGNLRAVGICEDMPRYLASLDLFICTSAFGEGFPNVIAEAMACGTPVVTTNVGDAAVIVSDNGRVCEVGDARALSDNINDLLNEVEGERQRRSAKAREHIVGNFSLDRMIQAFDRLYHNGITSASPGSSSQVTA
ncbi:MAG: glycosyltransferase [Pseudomonadota bacterium]